MRGLFDRAPTPGEVEGREERAESSLCEESQISNDRSQILRFEI
jgi:hypothetical protein